MNNTVNYKMSKISVERMMELEDYLKDVVLKNDKSFREVTRNIKLEESLYLLYACKMPIGNITDAINWYDVNECNPTTFLNSLCDTYGVTKEDAIKRIQSVRKIITYKEKKLKLK